MDSIWEPVEQRLPWVCFLNRSYTISRETRQCCKTRTETSVELTYHKDTVQRIGTGDRD